MIDFLSEQQEDEEEILQAADAWFYYYNVEGNMHLYATNDLYPSDYLYCG